MYKLAWMTPCGEHDFVYAKPAELNKLIVSIKYLHDDPKVQVMDMETGTIVVV